MLGALFYITYRHPAFAEPLTVVLTATGVLTALVVAAVTVGSR